MKKILIPLVLALGINSCTTPSDHFERVWILNTKLSSVVLEAFNAHSADEYNKAMSNLDEVVNAINSVEKFNENDTLTCFIKQQAAFTSRVLHEQQQHILGSAESKVLAKKLYLDSSSIINDKINVAATAFMKEYELAATFE